MITRRTFSFASLLLAAAHATARAGDALTEPPAEPFVASWQVTPASGKLTVAVSITNSSAEPVDYLAARGDVQATDVAAWIDTKRGDEHDVALVRVRTAAEGEVVMTRAGPVQQFVAVKPGETVLAATWEFELPKGAEREPFRLIARVQYEGGAQEFAKAVAPSRGA